MKFPENNFHFSFPPVSSFPPPSLLLVSPLLVYVRSFFVLSTRCRRPPLVSSACLLLNLRAKLLSSTINRTSRMRILANDANMPSTDGNEIERRGKGEKRCRVRLLLVFYIGTRIRAELILRVMSFHAFRRRSGRFKANCICTSYRVGFD